MVDETALEVATPEVVARVQASFDRQGLCISSARSSRTSPWDAPTSRCRAGQR